MLTKLFDRIQETAAPSVIELDGRKYTSKGLVPAKEPTPAALEVSHLSSLADYVNAASFRDGVVAGELIAHVVAPWEVRVLSSLRGQFAQRHEYVRAAMLSPWHAAGAWMKPEDFIVQLQSQFVDTPDLDQILKVVGNLEDSAVKRFSDDGVTQQVVVSSGILRRADAPVPRRVTLAPRRSFAEIEQVSSEFVLRMQAGKADAPPSIALFEADGGSWRNAAQERIKAYLTDKLLACVVVLA